jgi:molybdenum cofactor biosynthesis protein B
MVDFQSRDRKRTDDETAAESEASTGGESETTDEDGEGSHDHDHDHGHDHDHDHGHGHVPDSVGVAVVTVSSSRSLDDDPSGDAIQSILEDAGHGIVTREVLRDDYDGVQSAVDALAGRGDVDAIVTTGGTGVTPDDVTVEAVEPLFDKSLPGFGELFRRKSVEEIGTRVVATRATAGVVDGVPTVCLPGSENAARLGADEILTAELPHLVGLATRGNE